MSNERSYTSEPQQTLMRVVEYLAEDALTPKTRKELAEALDISPDAAWRTLWNLREAGWVEEAGGGYRIAPRIVVIADSFRRALADTIKKYSSGGSEE